MDDLDQYIEKRKEQSPKFAENFDKGYEQLKIGVLLKQACLEAGFTQEQVAKRLRTKKFAIIVLSYCYCIIVLLGHFFFFLFNL